jgi:hypothetical protein
MQPAKASAQMLEMLEYLMPSIECMEQFLRIP